MTTRREAALLRIKEFHARRAEQNPQKEPYPGAWQTRKKDRPACGLPTAASEPCQARKAWQPRKDRPLYRNGGCRQHGSGRR